MINSAALVTEFLYSFFISGVAAALWVVPLIGILYKLKFTAQHKLMKSGENKVWMQIRGYETTGTPSLGGILIWLTVPVVLLLLYPGIKLVQAVSAIFLLFGLVGFVDGYIDMMKKDDIAFREFQNSFGWRLGKLIVMLIPNILVSWLTINFLEIKAISFGSLIIPLNNIFGYFGITILSTLTMYATEIIDGIDALSAGMFSITNASIFLLVLVFTANFTLTSNITAMSIIGVIVGVLVVYLYFNIPPARFYMGGPGAMPMGPYFLIMCLYANVFPAFLLLISIYALDLLSSAIQLLSKRFLNRKIFRIAPIHHHFEAIGWPPHKVVMRFWLFNCVIGLLAIVVQLFLYS